MHLTALEELRIARTALDFDALLAEGLPPQLRSAALYSGKSRADASLRKRLDALGYREFTEVASK